MPAQDLTQARAMAESDRLGNPAEYQREILRVLLAILDSKPAEVKPDPAPKRR